jgi:hypothetical protein
MLRIANERAVLSLAAGMTGNEFPFIGPEAKRAQSWNPNPMQAQTTGNTARDPMRCDSTHFV